MIGAAASVGESGTTSSLQAAPPPPHPAKLEPPPPPPAKPEGDVLTDYLSARPTACPECQFLLTAATQARCPECGTRLKLVLKVRTTAREAVNARIWLMGLIGPCTALGVFLLEVARLTLGRFMGVPFAQTGNWWNIVERLLLCGGALLLLTLWVSTKDFTTRLHPLVSAVLAQSIWTLTVGLMAINEYFLI
jgi:hypothetical protein